MMRGGGFGVVVPSTGEKIDFYKVQNKTEVALLIGEI